MSRHYCWICLSFLLLMLHAKGIEFRPSGSSPTDENIATSGTIEPAAMQILKKAADFYRDQKTMETKLAIQMRIEMQGQHKTMESSGSLSVEKPRRMAFKNEGKMTGAAAFLDGTTMTLVFNPFKQYVVLPQPQSFDELNQRPELSMMSSGALALILPLISSDPYKQFVTGASHITVQGKDKIDGIECDKVSFEQNPMNLTVWIASNAPREVKKIQPDMLNAIRKMSDDAGENAPHDMKFDYEIFLRDQKFNAPLPDERFKAEIPDAFERSEQFGRNHASGEDKPHPLLGKPAPALKLDLLDGGKFDLAQHKGQDIVVLDFWATWCGPCRMSLPLVVKATNAFKDKGVKFFSVNLGDDPASIKQFISAEKLEMQVALDRDNSASEPFQFEGIPFSVIIDKQGIVQATHIGFDENTEANLKKELDTLLAGKSLAGSKDSPKK